MLDAKLHTPVMLAEVLEALDLSAGKVIVDATFGRGGYTQAILATGAQVIAFDRDPDAIAAGEKMAAQNPRLRLVHGAFGDMALHLERLGVPSVDGVVFDLGVSSPQLDEAARGFSFRADGPLDMRMDTSSGLTAAEMLDRLSEEEIADIIWRYGDERFSRKIARAIVAARPLTRTTELADIVRSVVHRKPRDVIDPATRTFQALRIAVNDELGELERGLEAAGRSLAKGGRLVVVSFHSLEDRIAKTYMRAESGVTVGLSRHMPVQETAKAAARLRTVGKQPIAASEAESRDNPRARSAKLRVAECVVDQGSSFSSVLGAAS